MNNDSLGLRITYRQRSFLLTGDMEKPMERRALMRRPSRYAPTFSRWAITAATPPAPIRSWTPFRRSFAIISDGFENSFRHPHPKVLERLDAHRAGVLRTDRDGLITIRTDGRRISVETFRVP